MPLRSNRGMSNVPNPSSGVKTQVLALLPGSGRPAYLFSELLHFQLSVGLVWSSYGIHKGFLGLNSQAVRSGVFVISTLNSHWRDWFSFKAEKSLLQLHLLSSQDGEPSKKLLFRRKGKWHPPSDLGGKIMFLVSSSEKGLYILLPQSRVLCEVSCKTGKRWKLDHFKTETKKFVRPQGSLAKSPYNKGIHWQVLLPSFPK